MKKIKKAIRKVLENELKDAKINVVFVGERRIRALNKNYRSIDAPTDVLTFVYKDEDLYAEIYVCPAVVEKNATKYKEPFQRELLRVLIHACLHVAGYDHELKDIKSKEMFEKQERYLREVDFE
ncbi:rRNA maturation RNase YbeY [Pseudothermotoga thermarum]|nr:rRNA maturation RNase YbeY [Pseudothermotoga thermarum]